MDDEYARLSLLAGFLAGAIDSHLGGHRFKTMIREHAWSLTPEKLARWKAEAIALGVPPDKLELTEEMKRSMPAYLKAGKRLQAMIDKRAAR
jgi:hypothetical protein